MRNGLQHFGKGSFLQQEVRVGESQTPRQLASRHTVSFARDKAILHAAILHIPSFASAHALLRLA